MTAAHAAMIVAVAVVAFYALVLTMMLRREPPLCVLAVCMTAMAALGLRLVWPQDFPPGYGVDETVMGNLCQIRDSPNARALLGATGAAPALLYVVFGAQWIDIIGVWGAVRLYSICSSVLACVGFFAVSRRLGMSLAAAWVAAALMAVMPWALLYGRTAEGGQLLWHQSIALWAIAGLVFAQGGRVEAAIAALALMLLIQDYYCGRALLYCAVLSLPFAATHQQRALLLMAVAIAWGGGLYAASVCGGGDGCTVHAWSGLWFSPSTYNWSVNPFSYRLPHVFGSLAALGHAADYCESVPAIGVHPRWFLGLAGGGVLTLAGRQGMRQGMWLVALFLAGLLPAIFGYSHAIDNYVSTHRMLMAYPVIVLAAASALEIVPWYARHVTALVLVCVVMAWAVPAYFTAPLEREYNLRMEGGEVCGVKYNHGSAPVRGNP